MCKAVTDIIIIQNIITYIWISEKIPFLYGIHEVLHRSTAEACHDIFGSQAVFCQSVIYEITVPELDILS